MDRSIYISQLACLTLLLMPAFLGHSDATAKPSEPLTATLSPLSPQSIYRSFFEGDAEDYQELFAESFLKVVSLKKLEEVRATYLDKLGPYRDLKGSEDGVHQLEFERGSAPSKLSIYEGRVVSLWFGAPQPAHDQRAALRQQLKATEGVTAALIMLNNSEVIFEHNAHLPLSVGSAFKLYVLKALLTEVEAGRRSLSEVIELSDQARSLPSGLLQTWPLGTPVTLATLATLMISRSDNTAADHLVLSLGRELIERHTPKEMRPLLMTREAFALKSAAQIELRAQYEDASEAERRQLLSKLKGARLSEIKPHVNPVSIQEVEWRASAVELCDVLWALRRHELLSLNTGLITAQGSPWDRVAFKGGSEPGVLNYSHLLMSWDKGASKGAQPSLTAACVIATINHPSKQVNPRFTELTQDLIAQATQALLARRSSPKSAAAPSPRAAKPSATKSSEPPKPPTSPAQRAAGLSPKRVAPAVPPKSGSPLSSKQGAPGSNPSDQPQQGAQEKPKAERSPQAERATGRAERASQGEAKERRQGEAKERRQGEAKERRRGEAQSEDEDEDEAQNEPEAHAGGSAASQPAPPSSPEEGALEGDGLPPSTL